LTNDWRITEVYYQTLFDSIKYDLPDYQLYRLLISMMEKVLHSLWCS